MKRWKRVTDRFGDTTYTRAGYTIQRFDGLAGKRYIWVLTEATSESKHTTLKAAKWEAERRDRKAQREER